MNANQIINMVLRMFVRKAMNTGMSKLSNSGNGGKNRQDPNLKQAKRAMKMSRRIGRM